MTFRLFDTAVGLTVVVVSLTSLLGHGSRLPVTLILFMGLLYLAVRVLRLIWVNTSVSLLRGTIRTGLCVVWNVGGHHRLVGLALVGYGSPTPSRVFGIELTIDLALLKSRNWEDRRNCLNGTGKTSSN